ncbi:unnamed protein product, partial [Prorocentrum cordatum]
VPDDRATFKLEYSMRRFALRRAPLLFSVASMNGAVRGDLTSGSSVLPWRRLAKS